MKSADEILAEHGIKLESPAPGRYYAICPRCSHTRSKEHQKAKVLGVTIENDRAHWGCNHCGWTGPERGNGNGRDRDRAGFETYDYCDADGTLKFQKVRNPPGSKTRFWMRRPDSHGGWINDTKGVDTNLLYRIEEMNEAIALGRTVLVVEGEKDVNNLWRIGIPAICNAHGASEPGKQPKWTKAHSEQLRGADIVVMPDHDAAGYAHADAVAKHHWAPPSACASSNSPSIGRNARRAATFPIGSPPVIRARSSTRSPLPRRTTCRQRPDGKRCRRVRVRRYSTTCASFWHGSSSIQATTRKSHTFYGLRMRI